MSENPTAPTHDDVSLPWDFAQWKRRDVDQVDLTALMAALSGTKWPGNGVGIVPTDVLIDEENGRRKAELALGNARAILEQFRVKEGESCSLHSLNDVK
jgi:phosphatidylinositol glycan class N